MDSDAKLREAAYVLVLGSLLGYLLMVWVFELGWQDGKDYQRRHPPVIVEVVRQVEVIRRAP